MESLIEKGATTARSLHPMGSAVVKN